MLLFPDAHRQEALERLEPRREPDPLDDFARAFGAENAGWIAEKRLAPIPLATTLLLLVFGVVVAFLVRQP